METLAPPTPQGVTEALGESVCGIVVSLPIYPGSAAPPTGAELAAALPGFLPASEQLADPESALAALAEISARLAVALETYDGPTALRVLADEAQSASAADRLAELERWGFALDREIDVRTVEWGADGSERVQGLLRQVRDQAWALREDRLGAARRARRLTPYDWTERSAISYYAVNTVLDALDRLEVRGRDSAGVSVWVHLDDADRTAVGLAADRADPLLRNASAMRTGTGACFVHKHAAIVGKLGDNGRHLRGSLVEDADLHRLLALPSASVVVLGHTRWASVGRTSEVNAHPVDSRDTVGAATGPYSIAVLNGDVDNYVALQERCGYHPHPSAVTTDAKLIPMLLSSRLGSGRPAVDAFRAALAQCEGSMAIAAQGEDTPEDVLLGVKGSGQSLYVGAGASGYLVASEAYGLVGATRRFVRVDGQRWAGADEAGTVLRLSRADAPGGLDGLQRWDGDGRPRPVIRQDIREAEVTTRDLALGNYEHYLEKEIHEAASSFRKTLRGRIHTVQEQPAVSLPESGLPEGLRAQLCDRSIRKVVLIGQGTAAVACQGIAGLLQSLVGDGLAVSTHPATEFSAWHLRRDMADTCVIAVSQSGSTTDTNRAVDLARERGARVVAIVNRRDSDLAEKSDGVLYTSDGRDVELSVASTKAFYAQVAAGCLLGAGIAKEIGRLTPDRESSLLHALQRVPAQLTALHATGDRIAAIASAVATRYPYWAAVGSGPNRVAAAEIRIKASELCYKTISADAVEDKKHIDLSAEALVLVCVAGAPPQQISDLVKEVEILHAHRNRAVVVCDEGTEHLWPTEDIVAVPAAHPELAWILATAAGHLFSYHAARAIDASAADVRSALTELEAAIDSNPAATPPRVPRQVLVLVHQALAAAARGDVRGVLSSQTAMALASIALVPAPGGPETTTDPGLGDPVSDARAALTAAIDELARPIDTVKHQAKTVTVGTSRGDSDLYDNDLVQALQATGSDPAGLTFPVLNVLRAHARVITQVTGVTRYRLREGTDGPQLKVQRKTGSAAALVSRADTGAPLTGSKQRVVDLRVPRLVRGRLDQRIVLVAPEQFGGEVTALSVLHVELRQPCPSADLRAAMDSVGDRTAEIIAAVTETVPAFTPDDLLALPTAAILLDPVESIAEALARQMAQGRPDRTQPQPGSVPNVAR